MKIKVSIDRPTVEDYDALDIGSKSLNLELERLEPSQIMLHPFFFISWLGSSFAIYNFYGLGYAFLWFLFGHGMIVFSILMTILKPILYKKAFKCTLLLTSYHFFLRTLP